jgi:hypothetical protein
MRELEIARLRIHARPDGEAERTLQQVIAALETNSPIDMSEIYDLDYDNFTLVMDIIRGWRLHRHTGVARNGVAMCSRTFIEKRAGIH